eukprot:TRINITY_DN68160_c0_g1_i1.p1 TRINITY_DN68160_c0_g1~~TRINITY_DN68160_c0_g1_i1.p1  ORF type:complete len:563 (+),score=40.73 TRINITY_DN68160_c0_g1_i1:132-1691(+)
MVSVTSADMSLTNQAYSNMRWLALAKCILIEHVGGFLYAFGLYSNMLKVTFDLSALQVDLIGSSGNIGGNVGLIGGFVYDRCGPHYIAGMAGLTGLCFWLLTAVSINAPFGNAVTLIALQFMLGQAQCWSDIVAIPTVQGYFPQHRGTVVGLVKSMVGLSSGWVAQVAVLMGISKKSSRADFAVFFGVLGIWFFLTCMIGLTITKPNPARTIADAETAVETRLSIGRVALLCLALYLLGTSPLQTAFDNEFWIVAVCTIGAVAIFLAILFFIGRPLGNQATSSPESFEQGARELFRPQSAVSMTLSQAMCTAIFWELFITLFASMGSGLVVVNNISSMAAARGENEPAVLVLILSVTNCIGRLVIGLISDIFVKSGRPRPVVLAASVGLVGIGHLLLACFGEGTFVLYLASGLCGFGYGGCFAMLATIPSEVFGLAHLGSIYSTYTIAVGGGSLLLATGLTSSVLTAHTESGADHCIGTDCFFITYAVCAGLCALASVMCLFVANQSKDIYRRTETVQP